jgi:hypothetical protein
MATQSEMDAEKALSVLRAAYGHGYASVHVVSTDLAATIATANALNTLGSGAYDGAPAFRRAILVPPGTYTITQTAIPHFVDIIGMTGDPDDVIIVNDGTGSQGDTLQFTGNNLVAFVTVNNTGSGFSLHPVWNNRDNGRDAHVVLHKVKANGGGTKGALAGQILGGQMFYAFECDFTANGQYAVYFHNYLTVTPTREAIVAFDMCTAINAGGPGVYFLDECTGKPDTFIWKGAPGSLDGSGTGNNADLTFGKNAGTASINLMVSTAAYATSSGTGSAAYFSDWPDALPVPRAMDANSQFVGFYGGDDRGLILPIQPLVPDASPQTVTALRQYYWPVRIPRMCQVGKALAGIGTTAAGVANLLLYQSDKDGKPSTLLTSTGSLTPSSNAKMSAALGGRLLYPGVYWLAAVFSDGTCTPIASSYAHLVQEMYYQDVAAVTTAPNPATPVALTSGPVPVVTAQTK